MSRKITLKAEKKATKLSQKHEQQKTVDTKRHYREEKEIYSNMKKYASR